MLYRLARPLLFALQPECAHDLSLWGMRHFGHWLPQTHVRHAEPVEIMGIRFPHRIGLAAGLDKNGEAIEALASFGFGFLEVGTVTPRAQPGNPQPRMFRFPSQEAIINRMGFNNKGADHLVEQIRKLPARGILGVSIGKNFDTPLELAAEDYIACLDKVYGYADYVAINISSPNTQNLRQLQGPSELDALLVRLKQRQAELAEEHGHYVPLVLKIAPDLDELQLAHMADILCSHQIDGVIATNTTLDHSAVVDEPFGLESGGLSGAPLCEKSTAIIAALADLLQGEIPIIASGGITTGKDALEKLRAGASLVQLYTGFIFHGPRLISDCLEATHGFVADSPDSD